MDILKFINSCDIREHLKNIDYQFSALEAAWIIWKSKYTSLSEKHEAWTEIIQTMPNCEIESRPNTTPHPSLHRFLRELMAFECRCIDSVKSEEPYTVFAYKYKLSEEDGWSGDHDCLYSELFSDFSSCLSAALDTCRGYSDTDDISHCQIRVQKSWFDGSGAYMDVATSQDGEITKIYNPGAMTEEEINLYEFGFDGMWFDFPNPFKRGDIIYNPGPLSSADFECDYGPCVLEEPIPLRHRVERWKKSSGGDSSDMVVHGLFQRDDGTVFAECTANYMNFEYYRGKLDGKKRILMAISNYLKDEISLELLLNAYHVILAEEHAKAARPYNITTEGLKLAGIPERKNDE